MPAEPDAFETTRDLLQAARKGDQAAISQIVQRYGGHLLQRIRGMMSPRLRRFAESQDLMQELFLDLVPALAKAPVDDEASFLRWATFIARNNVRDQARRRRRRELVQLDTSFGGTSPRRAETLAEPERAAALADDIERLEAALDSLGTEYRRVVELRSLERLDYNEIARELGRPSAAAARQLYCRAMARLTEKMLD